MSGDIDRKLAEAIRVAEDNLQSLAITDENAMLAKSIHGDLSILRALATCREVLAQVGNDPDYYQLSVPTQIAVFAAMGTNPFPPEPQ